MDERHEETKGLLGYLNDTRRSISWLLYLNDCGWGSASDEEKDQDFVFRLFHETQDKLNDSGTIATSNFMGGVE
jgi:hypothetical protein